jgi:DNA-binding NtrC family response regulator
VSRALAGSPAAAAAKVVEASTTVDVGSGVVPAGQRDEELPALLIAWAADEPERAGEVALFDADGGARILGRGAADSGGERAVFFRQRPGSLERTSPLASPGLSREQLRIRVEDGGLSVERVGKCAMEVRGERVERCRLAPGDTLLLRGQLLLLCTPRPRRLPEMLTGRIEDAPAFGEPDRHGIVGESPVAWRLRDRIAWAAQADEHTLLLGESGSGKELAARAIHALSARAQRAFVARNAATIPEGLVDAELFGNVKGYPNPGMPERPGLVGAADGGTLFLDEIGELPQALQANLLRVLDEGGEYHPLGSSAAKRSHFRLIGATNRSPDALKHDLAARLVVRLLVPGLDERREDIPLLVRHLLRGTMKKSPNAVRRFVGAAGEQAEPRVGASLIEHLLKSRYSTNLRELHALLWRAMSASTGDVIEWSEEAPPAAAPATATNEPRSPDSPPPPAEPPEPSADEVRASLEKHAGSVTRAAHALGLSSRYVLYRLMKRYGIAGEGG